MRKSVSVLFKNPSLHEENQIATCANVSQSDTFTNEESLGLQMVVHDGQQPEDFIFVFLDVTDGRHQFKDGENIVENGRQEILIGETQPLQNFSLFEITGSSFEIIVANIVCNGLRLAQGLLRSRGTVSHFQCWSLTKCKLVGYQLGIKIFFEINTFTRIPCGHQNLLNPKILLATVKSTQHHLVAQMVLLTLSVLMSRRLEMNYEGAIKDSNFYSLLF